MTQMTAEPTRRGRTRLLVAAGALSVCVAGLHVAILFLGGPAYRYFGAGERMARMAERGSSEPIIITVVLILMFSSWAVYAFSGAGLIVPLPRLRSVLLLIGLVFTARGLVVIPQAYFWLSAGAAGVPLRHVAFSAASLGVGCAYLLGTFQAWPTLPAR
jgi:hypothetical protein